MTGRRLLIGAMAGASARVAEALPAGGLCAVPSLVAWCLVPFAAMPWSLQQRAQLLPLLNLRELADDWRGRPVPAFDDESVQCPKHGSQAFDF